MKAKVFWFGLLVGVIGGYAYAEGNPGASAGNNEALIIETKGAVNILKAGAKTTIPAYTGQVLVGGDKIHTGADGHAIILFSNSSRIDLFANSRLQIQKKEGTQAGKKASTLGKLWVSIKSKFADTSQTGAQAGRVGTLRGPENEKPPEDEEMLSEDSEELKEALGLIDKEDLSVKTAKIMKAIVYEEYEQYGSAEQMYLEVIKAEPNDTTTYTMLIDLYLKLDLYNHASKLQKRLNKISRQ